SKGILRHARLNPDRAFDLPTAELDLNHLVVPDAQFLSRLPADQYQTVPNCFSDGVRQLLQPPVVVPTAIVHFVIAMEDDFEILLARRRWDCRRVEDSGGF